MALLAAFWAAGDVLMTALAGRAPDGARTFVSKTALGMGLWSAGLFALAATQTLRRGVLLVVFVIALLWALRRAVQAIRNSRGSARFGWSSLEILLPGALGAVLIFSLAFSAAAPTLGWDDAVYHLRLPALYLRTGGFASVPCLFQSHWPQNAELLFALSMALRGFVLAKLLHFACYVAVLATSYRVARRWASPLASASVPLLLLSTPAMLETARVAYIDFFVVLFVLLAFEAVLWASADRPRRRYLILAGVYLGFAAGTKLTAWLGVGALLLTWTLAVWKKRDGPRVLFGDLSALFGPTLLLAAPWLLKSWRETGNPIYPLFFGIFQGREWSADLARRATAAQYGVGMGREWLDYLSLPWRVFWLGGKSYARFAGVLGWQWLAVFAVAAVGWRRAPASRLPVVAAVCFFVLWALGPQQVRYLFPMLPLLGAAAAIAAGSGEGPTRRARFVTAGLATVAVLTAGFRLPPLAAAAWKEITENSGATLLLGVRNVAPALAYLERETPSSAKVLFLNNNRVFPLTREAVADGMFEASQIAEWLRPMAGASDMDRALRERGFTHVLLERVDWGIDWPPSLNDFLKDPERAIPLFETRDGRFVVYELARP